MDEPWVNSTDPGDYVPSGDGEVCPLLAAINLKREDLIRNPFFPSDESLAL
jgi:hypothetical protein